MQIKEIQIENFRSIKSETISFDKKCLILIGKNEAGKSNFLKAIAALFKEYTLSSRDRRKKISNEIINERYIQAVFIFSEEDVNKIEKEILENWPIVKDITFNDNYSLKDYIKFELPCFRYRIDVGDNNNPRFVHLDNKQTVVQPIGFISEDCNSFSIEPKENNTEIFELIGAVLSDLYDINPYKCIFWHYDNNLLLPDRVNIQQFVQDPSSCKSLQNVFVMCKRTDIKREFENAIEEDGDYTNLLEQVSKETTKEFRKIWKDFKNTAIELKADGNDILIKVADNAKYTFSDRSDGFKKFISVLLVLSTRARSNSIGERDIVLIDEPDQSLYPTSAKYLKDELLKISEKSRVIYSTHSQYMLDPDCIDRHLIVEKKDDITTINRNNVYAPYSDDELLRRAIGSSIFENLKSKNIIFEGWLDKEVFCKYRGFNKDKRFDSFGITYLHGINGASTLVSIMILAEKKFVIVADSDKTSVDRRKTFERDYPEYKDCWIAYGDIENSVSTLEDFFQGDYIKESIKTAGHPDFSYNKDKNAIENIEKCFPDKDERQKMKKNLVDNIEKTNIKDAYSLFVNAIYNKLNTL